MSFKWSHTFKYGFWWLFGCPRVIRDAFPTIYKLLKQFGEKNIFWLFWIFSYWFWPIFSLKVKKSWRWKIKKWKFFENEALNQKSGSVKVLGYVSTSFDDCGGLRNIKLGMPPSPCFHPSKQRFLWSAVSKKTRFLRFWRLLRNEAQNPQIMFRMTF